MFGDVLSNWLEAFFWYALCIYPINFRRGVVKRE